jgi:hypothetical protein
MIHSALEFLAFELNGYIRLRIGESEQKRVFLSRVTSETGGILIPDKSIGLSLINIEEEKFHKDQVSTKMNMAGKVEKINPEIKLNLYILITANFQNQSGDESTSDYIEGLKQLSYVISFFQSKNVFTMDNSPSLAAFDLNLKKLVVELYSYSFEQLYNFWSVVGAKYMPSVLYKVRILTIQENAVQGADIPIEKIRLQHNHKS